MKNIYIYFVLLSLSQFGYVFAEPPCNVGQPVGENSCLCVGNMVENDNHQCVYRGQSAGPVLLDNPTTDPTSTSSSNDTSRAQVSRPSCPSDSNMDENGNCRSRDRQNNSNSNVSSTAAGCLRDLQTAETALETATVTTKPEIITRTNNPHIKQCRALLVATRGLAMDTPRSTTRSTDGRVSCTRVAGYTLDFESCNSALNVYNYIKVLEQGMQMEQNMRLQNNQRSIAQKAALQSASGDGQNAALDASAQDNNFKSSLSQEQAMAYGAAVAALSAKISSWQSKSPSAMAKICQSQGMAATAPTQPNANSAQANGGGSAAMNTTEVDTAVVFRPNCASILTSQTGNPEVFANDNSKSTFIGIGIELAAKAAAAMIAAKKFSSVAAATKAAEIPTNMGNTPVLDKCVVNPTAAGCPPIDTTRTAQQGYQPGSFDMGTGASNAFTNTPLGDDKFGDTGNSSTTPATNVAGVTSPFKDAARQANGILNPAPAAASTPTGGAGGGGGGAGGGLGGGGGASLGNDLNGADPNANKANDIKANKTAVTYTPGGGPGFQAVKGAKDDANPFQSIFDAKNAGGVEEDRSIASDDIAGQDSGLFQKISRRYGQVAGEKRIEANNLE